MSRRSKPEGPLYKQDQKVNSVHKKTMKSLSIFFAVFAFGTSLDLTEERFKCISGKYLPARLARVLDKTSAFRSAFSWTASRSVS